MQTISISAGTFVKALVVGLLAWFLFEIRDIILIVFTAVVLAAALEPLIAWLTGRRLPRLLAVVLVYAGIISSLVLLVYFLLPPLLDDLLVLAANLPEYLDQLDYSVFSFNLADNISRAIITLLPSQGAVAAGALGSGFVQTVSFFFGGIFSFVLIMVLSFYLAVQERGVEAFLRLVTPTAYEPYILDLWRRSKRKIGLWMQGQLVLGFLMGVLVFLGLSLFRLKYALLLALFAALLELIPVVGPIVAAVPAVATGMSESLTLGLLVLGFYVVAQQFENHLLYPLVVRKIVGVAPLVVILAMIIGGRLAGFLGILLAVPVAAALGEFIDDLEKKKKLV